MKIVKSEILSSFQGEDNVRHIIDDKGMECWLTPEVSFNDVANAVGACKFNTIENERKHVLFLFNSDDKEVGRLYLGKKLHGKTPAQIAELKKDLCVFESWNLKTNTWVPCVGLAGNKGHSKETSYKKGCGLTTILKDGHYFVVDKDNNYIVPPGKYDYIDGFDTCGLARVKIDGKADIFAPEKSTYDRWGLIDTEGNEVLPLEYSEIWSFFNKNRKFTK